MFSYSVPMKALLFDKYAANWLVFENPIRILKATTPEKTAAVIEEIDRARREEGLFSAGYVSYEGAPGFDPHFRVKPQAETNVPLASFGLFREPKRIPALLSDPADEPCRVSPFAPIMSRAEYGEAFARVRRYLSQGNSYQVNLTYRLEARYSGDPITWFAQRVQKSPTGYPSYMEFEGFALCSLSPELFFELKGENGVSAVTMRPMKGTVRNEPGREKELSDFLKADPKNRAENLMIVDMTRNDLGRIALAGSVEVPSLFETEPYPTVIQMTSTVTARTKAGIPEIFKAVFPCASITGAPKRRSMDIIAELETDDRGVYTGAMGFVNADGSARFSVAIRTAVFDTAAKRVRYGIGGGIVWASGEEEEYDETLAKAAVLGQASGFYIFESLLLDEGECFLLERHMRRLESSIRYFGLDRLGPGRRGYDASAYVGELEKRLRSIEGERKRGRFKVRLAVRPEDGPGSNCELTVDPVPPLPADYTIALSKTRVDSSDPFTGHKTSFRHFIDQALKSVPGAADAALMNERGELTETSRGNIVLLKEGVLLTPPLCCGALNGTMRSAMIEKGELIERVLLESDFRDAEKVFMINSVRGIVECRRLEG